MVGFNNLIYYSNKLRLKTIILIPLTQLKIVIIQKPTFYKDIKKKQNKNDISHLNVRFAVCAAGE